MYEAVIPKIWKKTVDATKDFRISKVSYKISCIFPQLELDKQPL